MRVVLCVSACWNTTCDAGIDFGQNLCLTDLTGFMCAPVCKIHRTVGLKSRMCLFVYCIFNEWRLAVFELCNHLQYIGRRLQLCAVSRLHQVFISFCIPWYHCSSFMKVEKEQNRHMLLDIPCNLASPFKWMNGSYITHLKYNKASFHQALKG